MSPYLGSCYEIVMVSCEWLWYNVTSYIIRSMIEMHAAGCEGGQEAPVDCPLCGRVFPAQRIEQHVSSCMAWVIQVWIQWNTLQCPLCGRVFPAQRIEQHASSCMAWVIHVLIQWKFSEKLDQTLAFTMSTACLMWMAWLIILMHPVKNSCLLGIVPSVEGSFSCFYTSKTWWSGGSPTS